eukprot:CAMPEP_0118684750 /NCGR_PEP_ID=MMETSP0800-20121206/6835_1 /TAXON_ID=210618 ORGANISM="Striatella unipunctata, Strain CCMP2910" /NCGR_SAMPLE_ID=MMETSP0800 /ASSEMBLY_ACC=CAM_ASM_000638 /LENGTH=219 /DNA_ID=CAMNT_0006581527 /DNA_START=240 /DNA_END=899 /DNA_ORIENTATION=+
MPKSDLAWVVSIILSCDVIGTVCIYFVTKFLQRDKDLDKRLTITGIGTSGVRGMDLSITGIQMESIRTALCVTCTPVVDQILAADGMSHYSNRRYHNDPHASSLNQEQPTVRSEGEGLLSSATRPDRTTTAIFSSQETQNDVLNKDAEGSEEEQQESNKSVEDNHTIIQQENDKSLDTEEYWSKEQEPCKVGQERQKLIVQHIVSVCDPHEPNHEFDSK